MRPLPDLDNTQAMVGRGRRSALSQAWKEAREALRDASTDAQIAPIGDSGDAAREAIAAAERLLELDALWRIATGPA